MSGRLVTAGTYTELALDASALIAALDPTHQFSTEALDALGSAERTYIHVINLAEVLAGFEPPRHDAIVASLRERGLIVLTNTNSDLVGGEVMDASYLAAYRQQTDLKMTDVCALLVAEFMPLLTFDKAQAKGAIKVGKQVVANSITAAQ